MNLTPALNWSPPDGWNRITVIDSHTGGEPFRIVIDGLPEIPGNTVLERRRYAIDHMDDLRKALMFEPRGHADMYGGWISPPVEPDSDLAVLFLHNEGFSTMCGHGIIALTKVALDTGILATTGENTTIRIDTPAGQVTSTAVLKDGSVTAVSFKNVPSFAAKLDGTVEVPGMGSVTYDLGFGGGYYAYLDADSVGVDLNNAGQLIDSARLIKQAIVRTWDISHPVHPDLAFLYGVIFIGPAMNSENHSRNVCVFADGEVDRSPTGTGVSGRLAILQARGELGLDEEIVIESITGSEFSGRAVAKTSVGDVDAIVPEVTGSAHILGKSEYWFDPSDELGRGFLIR